MQNSLLFEHHQARARIALALVDRKNLKEVSLGTEEQDKADTIAVITGRPKVHALFFDRIDCQALVHCPSSSVPFEYVNRLMTWECCLFSSFHYLAQFLIEDPIFKDVHHTPDFDGLLKYIYSEASKYGLIGKFEDTIKIDERYMVRRHSEELRALYNVNAVPVYSSAEEFSKEFEPGAYLVTQRVIENLDAVDEEQLEWDQVKQFREDKDARHKYAQFLEFLKGKWSDKNIDYYTYNIESRYREYQESLRKHGIKTRLGFLKDIFSAKFILPASLAALVTQTTYPLLTPVVTGVFALGSLSLSIAECRVNLASVTPPDASIAWIYEVKKAVDIKK